MDRKIHLAVSAAALLGLAVLAGCGSSNNGPKTYTQFDRLARPAVNEVFATVANGRHAHNDGDNPTDDSDPNQGLTTDIQMFMTGTAGRSQQITDVVKAVLVPDVLEANLNSADTKAAYLGVETNGATGSTFGGRALSDDIIDRSLGIIFGNTIPALSAAGKIPSGIADDGKEVPTLVSDNVGFGAKHYQDGSVAGIPVKFPYVGVPQ